MSKAKLRVAVITCVLNNPFCGSDYVDAYASAFKLSVAQPADRAELQATIEGKGPPTSASMRANMWNLVDSKRKENGTALDDLPLGPVVEDKRMDTADWKALGRETTLDGADFAILFQLLTSLYDEYTEQVKAVFALPPSNGYFTLDLVVWALVQAALSKKLVRFRVRCVG